MVERLGKMIYWVATGLAVLLACAAGFTALQSRHIADDPYAQYGSGDWGTALAVLVFAVLLWGAGRAVRYVLSGN